MPETSPVVDLAPAEDISKAQQSVFVHSLPLPKDALRIKGFQSYDKAGDITVKELLGSFETSGFQASHLGKAVCILRNMLQWRLSFVPATAEEEVGDSQSSEFSWGSQSVRSRTRAKIFLSFTSNLISSGLREALVFLAKNRLVDVIVTTAGGIEEDFIKCLGENILGSFHGVRGTELRARGWNRIGNIYVPNDNYVKFEAWLQPFLDECLERQRTEHITWTPSKMIKEMGKRIADETSLFYWCYKNDIEVFCPAFTDGSIGDNLYFHQAKQPGLVVDLVQDISAINRAALISRATGMIILGGGASKHHVCNANLMRNGADFALYVNTGQEFDGCDSGAAPDEAVSWGKIKATAQSVKVCCDATIAFPLLVATVCKEEAQARSVESRRFPRPATDKILLQASSEWSNTPDGFILSSPWHA